MTARWLAFPRASIGVTGAFAEFVAVPEHIVYAIPEALTFEHAAMIEAVSVAVHAVGLTPVKLGDTGVVVGARMNRPPGNSGAAPGRMQSNDRGRCERSTPEACKRIRNRPLPERREIRRAGRGRAFASGRGADVAMEVVGVSETVQTGALSLRKGGALTLVGNVSPKVEFLLQWIVTRQLRGMGSCASAGKYPACIDLVASRTIRVDSLISATAPLQDGQIWFDRLFNREPNLLKVVLQSVGGGI